MHRNTVTLFEKVKQTIEKHRMLDGVKKLIIAFSSGPDSVCLLDVLDKLYPDIKMHLVYVNHGLRPAARLKKEEDLTSKYAAQYSTDHTIMRIKIRKTKIGVEASARVKRHNTLKNIMKKVNAQRIALGHNLDDVIETFLMNLIRGSGARGFQSIPAVRTPYIRPLIDLKKDEILDYLRMRKLKFSRDETNRQLQYRRNIIRRKIIPEFLKLNPELHDAIRREINILKQDDSYIEQQADRVFRKYVKKSENYVTLDIEKIMRYNPAVRKRVVMKATKTFRSDLDGFESKHFEAVLSLKCKESGKKVILPKGLYARREFDTLVLGRNRPKNVIEMRVDPEKDTYVFDRIAMHLQTVTHFDLKKTRAGFEAFDLDALRLPLIIRNRRRGDKVKTKIGHKKLKKFFNEARIPVRKRDKTMMLCDQEGILMILGVARAHRAMIKKQTKKCLVVKLEHIN